MLRCESSIVVSSIGMLESLSDAEMCAMMSLVEGAGIVAKMFLWLASL